MKCKVFLDAKQDEELVNLRIWGKNASLNITHFARTKDIGELREYAKTRVANGEEFLFGPAEEAVQELFR